MCRRSCSGRFVLRVRAITARVAASSVGAACGCSADRRWGVLVDVVAQEQHQVELLGDQVVERGRWPSCRLWHEATANRSRSGSAPVGSVRVCPTGLTSPDPEPVPVPGVGSRPRRRRGPCRPEPARPPRPRLHHSSKPPRRPPPPPHRQRLVGHPPPPAGRSAPGSQHYRVGAGRPTPRRGRTARPAAWWAAAGRRPCPARRRGGGQAACS